MASIKWSALVSEVKGVLNGSILSVGYGGQTIRNRYSRSGRLSASWSASRSRLQYVAGLWRGFTPADQSSFSLAAPDFQYVNKFGNLVTPSGFQLACTLNSNLFFIGATLLHAAPEPRSQDNIGTFTLSQSPTGQLSFTWSVTGAGNQQVCVYMSRPMGLGVTSAPRFMRFIAKQLSNNRTAVDCTSAFEAIYGAIPASGRVFYRVDLIDTETGQRFSCASGYLDV